MSPADLRRLLYVAQNIGNRTQNAIEAVHSLVAVQTQYAMSLPNAVAVRSRANRKPWWTKAIQPGNGLVKSWTVRYTLHTMTDENYGLLTRAFGERQYARYVHWMKTRRNIDEKEVDRRQKLILDALKEGPQNRKTLHRLIPAFQEMEGTGWGTDVMGLAFRGEICIVSHNGPTTFASREPNLPKCSKEDALDEVLRRYLRAYGAASVHDFDYWTGHLAAQNRPAFRRIREELVEVRCPNQAPFFALRDVFEATMSERFANPSALLAKFDVSLLGHKSKTFFLSDRDKPKVFRIAGQIEAPLLLKGRIRGTWRMKSSANGLEFRLEVWSKPLSGQESAKTEAMAASLAMALGHTTAKIAAIQVV